MQRRILGFSLLFVLTTLTLLSPLFGFQPTNLGIVMADPFTPGPTDLNATTPIISYDEFTPANPNGNSSLLDVVVTLVNASDIGECKDGDLSRATFGVHFNVNSSVVFQDNLTYVEGLGWAALNYSLLEQNLNYSSYKVSCHFERIVGPETWVNITKFSSTFIYSHRLTIAKPDFTYIGDTSDTIDVHVAHISSTIWGSLTEITTTSLVFEEVDDPSNVTTFIDVLQYNLTSTQWEVNELNISELVPNLYYKILVVATYSIRLPYHSGVGTKSDAFRFQGPYLRIAEPVVMYIGRNMQILNITVDWVWHSIFGYLNDSDLDAANFSIYLAIGGAALVNGTLTWNGTSSAWDLINLNISYYIEEGIIAIGEYYNVTTFFNALARSGRPAVNASSPFSSPFLIDRDPPNVNRAFISPDVPTDEDFVRVTGEISDDALIEDVICSYFNGTSWINITMRGTPSKLANYTATIPRFSERFVVQYRIYASDTQSAWTNSTVFSYTISDTSPVIGYVSYGPSNPTDMNTVTVNATVTDGTAVSAVQLYFSFDGINFISVEMQHIGNSIYQAIIPPHTRMSSFEFAPVFFRVEATDVFGNTRVSANFAFLVQGTLFGINPAMGLLTICIIALIVVVLIMLYKVYERY